MTPNVSVSLTLKSAVEIANQTARDMNVAYPLSFVAVPAAGDHQLKLRVIAIDAPRDEEERSAVVSYATGPHGFSNSCRRIIAELTRNLRDGMAAKRRLAEVG